MQVEAGDTPASLPPREIIVYDDDDDDKEEGEERSHLHHDGKVVVVGSGGCDGDDGDDDDEETEPSEAVTPAKSNLSTRGNDGGDGSADEYAREHPKSPRPKSGEAKKFTFELVSAVSSAAADDSRDVAEEVENVTKQSDDVDERDTDKSDDKQAVPEVDNSVVAEETPSCSGRMVEVRDGSVKDDEGSNTSIEEVEIVVSMPEGGFASDPEAFVEDAESVAGDDDGDDASDQMEEGVEVSSYAEAPRIEEEECSSLTPREEEAEQKSGTNYPEEEEGVEVSCAGSEPSNDSSCNQESEGVHHHEQGANRDNDNAENLDSKEAYLTEGDTSMQKECTVSDGAEEVGCETKNGEKVIEEEHVNEGDEERSAIGDGPEPEKAETKVLATNKTVTVDELVKKGDEGSAVAEEGLEAEGVVVVEAEEDIAEGSTTPENQEKEGAEETTAQDTNIEEKNTAGDDTRRESGEKADGQPQSEVPQEECGVIEDAKEVLFVDILGYKQQEVGDPKPIPTKQDLHISIFVEHHGEVIYQTTEDDDADDSTALARKEADWSPFSCCAMDMPFECQVPEVTLPEITLPDVKELSNQGMEWLQEEGSVLRETERRIGDAIATYTEAVTTTTDLVLFENAGDSDDQDLPLQSSQLGKLPTVPEDRELQTVTLVKVDQDSSSVCESIKSSDEGLDAGCRVCIKEKSVLSDDDDEDDAKREEADYTAKEATEEVDISTIMTVETKWVTPVSKEVLDYYDLEMAPSDETENRSSALAQLRAQQAALRTSLFRLKQFSEGLSDNIQQKYGEITGECSTPADAFAFPCSTPRANAASPETLQLVGSE